MKQHKYWVNEFNDSIIYDSGDSLTYSRWMVLFNNKYKTSFGGLNLAKKYINDFRNKKTLFKKIEYKDL